MTSSTADVQTSHASRYLGQLCKHFAHRIPASFDGDTGRIEFPAGLCLLQAQGDVLQLRLETADAGALDTLEDVVARHLERFAFRDTPAINWVRA